MSSYGIFGGLAKGVTEIAGMVVGGVINAVGEVVDSSYIKEIGDGVTRAGKIIGDRAGRTINGTIDVATSLANGNKQQRSEGLNQVGGAVKDTAKGMLNAVGYVGENMIDLGSAAINMNKDKAIRSGKNLGKAAVVMAVASLAIPHITPSVGDIEHQIGFDHDMDASSIHAIDTGHGLIPGVDINSIPGVHNGVMNESAFSNITHLGEVDCTHHISEPPRSVAMEHEFLDQHGLPHTHPGYQVHHVIPLSEGGADVPQNMVLVPEHLHEEITTSHDAYYKWHAA